MANNTNCPNVLATGTCQDQSCPHVHKILTCEPCGLLFQTLDMYKVHLTTKKHHSKVSGRSVINYCSICEANVPGGQPQWDDHIRGRKHDEKATDHGVSPNITPLPPITTCSSTVCDICQVMVPNRFWHSHLNSGKHKMSEQFTRYMSAVEQSETDKNGVIVEGSFDFDFVDPPVAQVGKEIIAIIKTSRPGSNFILLGAKLASAKSGGVSSFSLRIMNSRRDVSSLCSLTLVIGFKQAYIGRYQDRLELIFEDTQLRNKFIITRALKGIVGNKDEHEELRPKAPYVPRSRSNRSPVLKVVEGIKPPTTSVIPYVGPLPKALIPARLQTILSSKDSVAKVTAQIKNTFIPEVFNSASYAQHFKYLLWIEENQMEQDIEHYDMMNATLNKHNHFYYLTVPGLAEKRPSVLVGDCILVQTQGATDGRWFEGHVHVLRQTEVGLRLHRLFEAYAPDRRFHVRFKLNRIPMRRQHQAMDTVFTEERVLFPLVTHLPGGGFPLSSDAALRVYNSLISSNGPQLQAVVSVVAQRPGSLPFIVFGPPGTGKTITIVECIRQILVTYPQAKVLACAPSNSAADLIASRLRGHLSTDELFRFYAPSRFRDQVPDDLRQYTSTQADGHFTVPPMARLKRFRVIVSTCVSASFCSGVGMTRGHFSHIFIDEAGQATEPEVFVSIKMMADTKTNIILSGDPKQLGPVIRSGIARELGLEKSYLERLMDTDVYNHQTGHGRSVIKLTKNFRSHNAILHFPNERFYHGDLVPCGDPTVINSYLKSQYLPSSKFPIVFHAVSGKDDREASSPSFFNIDEVLQVKSYVQKLKEDRKFRTADKDIGIIAPYHAQCLKLRNSLRNVADGVKVGSVEEFQGQERRVIIISTVRSSKEFIKYDLRHTLGFVAHPRRFNVAVTRAQAMLIIVGDPQVLSLDPLWRSFLNYIYLNGGWTGPDITWDPRADVDETGGYDKQIRDTAEIDMNEFTRHLEAVTIDGVDEELDANVDRPWNREDE